MTWRLLAFAFAVPIVLWLLLVVVVFAARPKDANLNDALRLLPDTLRLLKRLATDRTVPFRTRLTLWILVAYLVSPIDLVPDFIPVVGYADDVIITSLVLRHLVRRAGSDKLTEQWPGTTAGLATIRSLLRIPERDVNG
jgi:uncharacterized membrane protein YkvA (DUF1232 family)